MRRFKDGVANSTATGRIGPIVAGFAQRVFDSHCHLHDVRMAPFADRAIERARARGVTGFMLAGVEPEGWRVELALKRRHADCAVSYGVHPELVGDVPEPELWGMIDELARAVAGRGWPRPAALGELGLDRAAPRRKGCQALQEKIFRAQLALARDADLPIILHVRDAHGRALQILGKDGMPRHGGVVHSYSGPAELVASYERLGFHISFSGIVCQPRARRARAAAACVAKDRLLVETDAPDQTPLPHRPAANEPAFLPAVVASLAELRGETPQAIARTTETNARTLFGAGA